MPMDALAPYLSTDDSTAARMESAPQAGDYRRRQGFYSAANLLLETATRLEDWHDRDPLIWPALYNFRHYVELTLKMLARDTPGLISGEVPTTHRLSRLWQPARNAFQTVFPLDDPGRPVEIIDECLRLLEALDPGGDGLRYSTTRRGAPSINRDVYLDPAKLLAMIREVEGVFAAAEAAFDAHQTFLNEMWSEFSSNQD